MRHLILTATLPFALISVIVVISVSLAPDIVVLGSMLSFGLLPLAYGISIVGIPLAVLSRRKALSTRPRTIRLELVLAVIINTLVLFVVIVLTRPALESVLWKAMGT